jgi:hypothetical protein
LRVVHVNAEIQPSQTQPVVGEVQTDFYQRRADALALPVVAHHYPEVPRMPRPRVRVDAERELPNDLVPYAGQEREAAVSFSGQLFSHCLLRGERYTVRSGHSPWGGVDAVNSLVIFRFAARDDQIMQAGLPSSSEIASSHRSAGLGVDARAKTLVELKEMHTGRYSSPLCKKRSWVVSRNVRCTRKR